MNDITEQVTAERRAFGKAFAAFKSETKRSDGLPRCEEVRLWGTGTGLCDTPLDENGDCPNSEKHLS